MDEPLEHQYFNWLCAKATHVQHPTPSLTFFRLFRQLHHTEFVWLISGDDNRAEDGLELRDEFLMESGQDDDPFWEGLGCSVFEMLISFSRRASFMAGETSQFWFWKFLENLTLGQANDGSDYTTSEIDEILNTFVWRGYLPSGQGGLFPMHSPPDDQRKVEIWYQFCEYLIDSDWPL